jgi:predicted nucleic acid-binding protein
MTDSSVFTRLRRPAIIAELETAMERGLVHTCAVVRLEVLRGAQSRADWRATANELRGLPMLPIDAHTWQRAEEVQDLLVRPSHHTAVKVPDLLVAAVAEQARLPVIHYDRDFDLIAEVTRQDCRWVVPRGSID